MGAKCPRHNWLTVWLCATLLLPLASGSLLAQEGPAAKEGAAKEGAAQEGAAKDDPVLAGLGPGGEPPAAKLRVDPQKKTVRLRLRECIVRALKRNLDIRVDAFNPLINKQDIVTARSVFDPTFFANVSRGYTKSDTTTRQTFLGDVTLGRVVPSFNENSTFSWDFGVRKATITGGTLELSYTHSRSKNQPGAGAPSTAFELTPNDPTHAMQAQVALTQPLLRGAGAAINRTNILIAENNRDASVYSFQQTLINVITNVELRYYDLVLARENLRVARKGLELSEQQRKRTRALIDAGTNAPIEMFQADANVASREESIIVAENAVRDAEDNLKNVIDPLDEELLDTTELVPISVIDPDAEIASLAGALTSALRRRPELLAARANLNTSHLQVTQAKDGLLPQVNLTGSFSVDGNGHTTNETWQEVGEFRFFSWAIGLAVEVPLGNRSARAAYRRAKLVKAQAEVSLKRAERNIVIEVRAAHRAIATARKRIAASNESLRLAQRQLEAEEARFAAGDTTLFQVNQFTEDVISAETRAIQSRIDFLQAASRLRQAGAATLDRLERFGVLVVDKPRVPAGGKGEGALPAGKAMPAGR